MLLTARQLKEVCGDIPFIFRAGAWKPRTNPSSFQGAGEAALQWLSEAKRLFGIEIATEVATPEHVEDALRAGVDYLWIGARTSANPIAVENLTESLFTREGDQIKGIFIKNPANEDAGLWIGNIERLEKTSVPVAAVHRGCGHKPCWAMAHQVRLARPDIPMLIDPSHMSGDADKIALLLEKAATLQYDGTMIEVHPHPTCALSDAKQQITPAELASMLKERCSIKALLRNTTEGTEQNTELNWLRAEIDELDDQLWQTISDRMDVSRRIGEWKKAHGVEALQPQRYQEIINTRSQWAQQHGLTGDFAKQIFDIIHQESLKKQL